jgi:hypothetical protein
VKSTAVDKVQWAQDAAHTLLMTQLDLGGVLEDDDAAVKRMVSSFGFGYVFGFAEQLLQVASVTDEVRVMAQLTFILTRVFGKEQGPKIFGKCLRSQNDSEFLAARLLGAQEVRGWLAAPEKDAPMGLAQYLNGGKVRDVTS